MVVSNARVAAQIVAPGEEPSFFDDIGCVVNALKRGGLPDDALVYIADYRTGQWIVAHAAVYARVESLDTPMGSHLIAFADEQSRGADRSASSGVAMTAAEVFSGTRIADVRAR
jgi:copper chaperone NosL